MPRRGSAIIARRAHRAGTGAALKIATFNVNNVNKRLPQLLAWLKAAKPDVACLQELKAEQSAFPEAALRKAGYHAVWAGQRTWNGVAIIAKKPPVLIRDRLPGDPKDDQSRYIEAAVDGVVVACIYAPNGNPQPGPKFDTKIAWMKRLHAHAGKLLKTGAPIVIAGDFNVAPTPLDIYPTRSWDKDALIQPAPRAAYAKLLKQGWTDAIRALHPEERVYTFWSYWRNRYERDAGLRIDHLLLSPDLAARLSKAGVDREVRGQDDPSDHAPVWIKLRVVRRNTSYAN
jgi:exodeoxyribonuclease-3